MNTTIEDVKQVLARLEQDDFVKELSQDNDFLSMVAMGYRTHVKASNGNPELDLQDYTLNRIEWVVELEETRNIEIKENPVGLWGFRDGVE